jgi:hypothetical protein
MTRRSLGYVVVGYNPGYGAGSMTNPGMVADHGTVHPLNGPAREAARKLAAHDQIDEMNTKYLVAELLTEDDGSAP